MYCPEISCMDIVSTAIVIESRKFIGLELERVAKVFCVFDYIARFLEFTDLSLDLVNERSF